METTRIVGLYRGTIGIMEKKMETTSDLTNLLVRALYSGAILARGSCQSASLGTSQAGVVNGRTSFLDASFEPYRQEEISETSVPCACFPPTRNGPCFNGNILKPE